MVARRLTPLLLLLALVVTACASGDSPAARAAALLQKMGLADKIGLLHGVASPGYTGATVPNPALNIPALKLNDGRQGFRPNDAAVTETAFPCQLANVATWDTVRAFFPLCIVTSVKQDECREAGTCHCGPMCDSTWSRFVSASCVCMSTVSPVDVVVTLCR